MSLQETIAYVLGQDDTLAELLTGGIYTGTEITRQAMPEAFDENSEILPCALVKAPSSTQNGPFKDSKRTMIQIFFYQRTGTETIGEAMERAQKLLEGTKPETGVWEMRYADQVEDQFDPGLECSLGAMRWQVWRRG